MLAGCFRGKRTRNMFGKQSFPYRSILPDIITPAEHFCKVVNDLLLLFLISGFESYNMQLQSSQECGIITVII